MQTRPSFFPRQTIEAGTNRWDWALLPLVLATLLALGYGATQMARPFHLGDVLPLTLDPWQLPYYLLRTLLRMFAALAASLVFSAVFAVLAAKYRAAEAVLVPLLDILQSIPILGFLSITVTGFIALFPGSLVGVECAAIFAIFTSQAWNMAFSLYQSLRSVPAELVEAARVFQLSGWQRFWRLELPFAMPGLLWNMMMSMSGGWFFVVASEAISVSNQSIRLPGIGSYIALAIEARDLGAMAWAISTMALGIVVVDQLLFRPLVAWGHKFRFEEDGGAERPRSWLLAWLGRTRGVRTLGLWVLGQMARSLGLFRLRFDGTSVRARPPPADGLAAAWLQRGWTVLLALAVLLTSAALLRFVHTEVGWPEVGHVFVLGLYTGLRVLLLIALAALLWVPVGVWIGLNPRWAGRLQALAQVMAAFPANLLFPVAVVVIVRWRLNPDLWLSPLMVFGTQWYILFNVIAGASAFPGDLREAAQLFRVGGWLWWRKVILPGVVPYFVTGAITASGGSWNASIVAEVVSWGDTKLAAHGLGAYIAQATDAGNFQRLVLGVVVMSLYVLAMNRLIWRPLYAFASRRTTLG